MRSGWVMAKEFQAGGKLPREVGFVWAEVLGVGVVVVAT